jgi:hypothetical protein
MQSPDATRLPRWTTWTGSTSSTWFTQGGPKGSQDWSSRSMRRGSEPMHTRLCRDERGGSLPDEVGSSPQDYGRRKRGRTIRENLQYPPDVAYGTAALGRTGWSYAVLRVNHFLGSGRKIPKMSRNTHVLSPSN